MHLKRCVTSRNLGSQLRILRKSRALEIPSLFFFVWLSRAIMRKIGRSATVSLSQSFFAVGKPHRPTDAKLTGEETGRHQSYKTPGQLSEKRALIRPAWQLAGTLEAGRPIGVYFLDERIGDNAPIHKLRKLVGLKPILRHGDEPVISGTQF
jgi:hypothetical protein